MPEVTWDQVQYVTGSLEGPRTEALIGALRSAYANGDALLFRFIPTDAEAFDLAARHDLRGLDHMLAAFLRAPSVQVALAEIELASCPTFPPSYHSIGAFELEGALTHALIRGGAYRGGVPEEAARKLSRDFVEACFQDHRRGITVFVIHGAWTRWFHDVAWDMTYIAYDPGGRNWTCLVATDTD
jgi:hypothetical protein